MFIQAIYIPSGPNSATKLDAMFIVADDYYYCNLWSPLPKYRLHVCFLARETNILDQVYRKIKGVYKAVPRAQPDHISVFLYPEYRQLLKQTPPLSKTIGVWNEKNELALQDCLENTNLKLLLSGKTLLLM